MKNNQPPFISTKEHAKQSQPENLIQIESNYRFNNMSFHVCLIISVILHLSIASIFLFGLPHFPKEHMEDLENVITFEMLPVSTISNVETQIKQNEKAIENEQAKNVQQSKPDETIFEQKLEEPKLKEKLEETKTEAEIIVKPEKITPKTEPEKQPKEIRQEPKKKELKKKLPTNNDLDSLLKTLEQSSQGVEAKSSKHSRAQQNNTTKTSKGSFNALLQLSISEQNVIKQQIQRHWNIPLAAQNTDEVIITLHIELNKDGIVTKVQIVDKICPNLTGSVCQALANSAERAVWQANPIQNLISENYNNWKEFNLSFYPKDAS